MHLPPEVERLVPGLLTRVTEPGALDAASEAARIERLLLAGDEFAWLEYLRDRGALVIERAQAVAPEEAIETLAGIFRDQLVLIQASIDLDSDDQALLDSLERHEGRAREKG